MRNGTQSELLTTCLANVRPESIRWLWPDVIPLGKLTVIAGDPGLGKSFVTLDLAARVSRGTKMPNCDAPGVAGHVVLLTAEDGIADTIRPRLDAHGADVSRIHAVRGVMSGNQEIGFSLARDLELVKRAVRELEECALVVIDPITAYLDKVDANSNAEVRRVLDPLARFAEELGVAVVVVTHLNKSGAGSSSKAVHRIVGSIAFTAAARAVWGVTKDRTDPERRLVLPVKMNIARDVGGMAYTIRDGRLVWEEGTLGVTADDMMSGAMDDGARGASALDEAIAFLRAELKDGPMPAREIKRRAERAGIAEWAIKRAKTELDVQSRKSDTMNGGWLWALSPSTPSPSSQQ